MTSEGVREAGRTDAERVIAFTDAILKRNIFRPTDLAQIVVSYVRSMDKTEVKGDE